MVDQASVSTEPGLEIGPVNCGKLLNCNEFIKYVVQIVNKERRSLKKIIIIIIIIIIIFEIPVSGTQTLSNKHQSYGCCPK